MSLHEFMSTHTNKTVRCMSMDLDSHYKKLFSQLVSKYGDLDPDTLTSIVGFSAGGPVSLGKIGQKNLYVSVELSLYKHQIKSSEGLNYEFLSIGAFDEDTCRALFTALGNLSMNATLGNNHTIDVSGLLGGKVKLVKLSLFSKTRVGLFNRYGVYLVQAV